MLPLLSSVKLRPAGKGTLGVSTYGGTPPTTFAIGKVGAAVPTVRVKFVAVGTTVKAAVDDGSMLNPNDSILLLISKLS